MGNEQVTSFQLDCFLHLRLQIFEHNCSKKYESIADRIILCSTICIESIKEDLDFSSQTLIMNYVLSVSFLPPDSTFTDTRRMDTESQQFCERQFFVNYLIHDSAFTAA